MSPFVDEDDDAETENDADCGIHAEMNPLCDSVLVSHKAGRNALVGNS
jgi:hypothetical protein